MDQTPKEILLLPETVINQIAAGEVVERPASVVKELVENSIDAGALRIEVTIENGGSKLITVTDNGRGINPSHLETAMTRHATNKISNMDDLLKINTFGFRGEALPSIASVSKMRISSRATGEDLSSYILIEGGKVKDEGIEVSTTGTRIEIKDLFFNVPARLKFLKTVQTESSHVHETLLKFALAFPNIHFSFYNDGRLIFDFPPHPDFFERCKSVLKRRKKGSVRAKLTWHKSEPIDSIKVEVVLSPPEICLRDAGGVYLLVNNRAVHDRVLLRAVTGGYGALLDRGRYPIAVISLTLPPQGVDVNVHPRKTEVKFLNERAVAGAIRGTVTAALASAPWSPLHGESNGPSPTKKYLLSENLESAEKVSDYESTRNRILKSIAGSDKTIGENSTSSQKSKNQYSQQNSGSQLSSFSAGTSKKTTSHSDFSPGVQTQASLPIKQPPKFLGSHGGLFLFFSLPQKVLVLDMHAAHERIRYSEIIVGIKNRSVISQTLLFPVTVPLSPPQYELALNHIDKIKIAGLDIELFGTDTAVIRSYPAILNDPPMESLLYSLLDEIESGGSGQALGGIQDTIAATMACHSAVRKGDKITDEEAVSLLIQLENIESSGHCPHGRPVSFTITNSELETRFKRT
jgi:DNA mismatch repair protein MutL